MPTIFINNGYRFFFYSNEHMPLHIHVEKNNKTAKFNINPVELVKNNGFNAPDLKKIRIIINQNKESIIQKWYEYFNY